MTIEFFEDTHTYLVDGVLTPSVTELIHQIYMPDQYANISSCILQKAADYGNRVHSLIEQWNRDHTTPDWLEKRSYENIALTSYISFANIYKIEPISQEQEVAYLFNDNALWAGKYDMLAYVGGKLSVIDIKTTAKYYPDYLSKQCTMYRAAIEQMTGQKIEEAYCIHLPKKGRKSFIKVDMTDVKAIERDVRLYGKKHHI